MQAKEQGDWTEEEHKFYQDYEKKVKDLNEEREKYRKVNLLSIKCTINNIIS